MAYIPIDWENLPSTDTPVNATNLSKMETGIKNNSDNIGELTDLDTSNKNNLVGAVNEINGKFGKLLWEGSFTTGSITISGLSDYTTIIAIVGGATCIGSLTYGSGGAGGYSSYATSTYNYRFGISGNTLTIDNINRGGSDGTQNVAVTKIYGLF